MPVLKVAPASVWSDDVWLITAMFVTPLGGEQLLCDGNHSLGIEFLSRYTGKRSGVVNPQENR